VLVFDANTGDYSKFIDQFQPIIEGGERSHVLGESIKQILDDACTVIKEETIQSTLHVPTVKDAMVLCEYFFDRGLSEISREKKKELDDYFSKRLKTTGITMVRDHSLIIGLKRF